MSVFRKYPNAVERFTIFGGHSRLNTNTRIRLS